VTAAELAARLAAVPSADVAVVALYLELGQAETLHEYLTRWDEINQALTGITTQLDTTKRIGFQCKQLPSRPALIPPPGL